MGPGPLFVNIISAARVYCCTQRCQKKRKLKKQGFFSYMFIIGSISVEGGSGPPFLATPIWTAALQFWPFSTSICRDHICYLPVCFQRKGAPLIFRGKIRTIWVFLITMWVYKYGTMPVVYADFDVMWCVSFTY